MYRFDIDINPVIAGKEIHLEGICEMLSSDTFKVTMTEPYKGLSVTKQNTLMMQEKWIWTQPFQRLKRT